MPIEFHCVEKAGSLHYHELDRPLQFAICYIKSN